MKNPFNFLNNIQVIPLEIFHERIDSLEEQIDVMSRLVELQSGTVAAAQLPEQPQPAEVAAAPEPARACSLTHYADDGR